MFPRIRRSLLAIHVSMLVLIANEMSASLLTIDAMQRARLSHVGSALLLRAMTNSFYPVTKWVVEEGTIVVVMVVLTEARRPIIRPSVSKTCGIKGRNLGPSGCFEAPMALCIEVGLGRSIDGQARMKIFNVVASHAVAKRAGTIIDFSDTKCCHHCVVKWASNFNAWDGDGNVVEYEHRQVFRLS